MGETGLAAGNRWQYKIPMLARRKRRRLGTLLGLAPLLVCAGWPPTELQAQTWNVPARGWPVGVMLLGLLASRFDPPLRSSNSETTPNK